MSKSDPKENGFHINEKRKSRVILLLILLVISSILVLLIIESLPQLITINDDIPGKFNGKKALDDVKFQVSLGSRTPGSQAHQTVVDWIAEEVQRAGWETEIQTAEEMGHSIQNVIGRWGNGRPWLVLGVHFDNRFYADEDPNPDNRTLPVPGANDGASGVAVLLEIARQYPMRVNNAGEGGRYKQIWLLFFDAEDNGNIQGWNWILGSSAFVNSLNEYPDAAVILDMIGDKDLQIYQEIGSDSIITDQIWKKAAELGYSSKFIPEPGESFLDDHVPFQNYGIPAALVIDFDYPFWHTIEDTPKRVSAKSLEIVGETILEWLIE